MSVAAGFDDDPGWLDGMRRAPSPNCDARPEGAPVNLVVVHSISLPPGEFGGDDIERFFTNRLRDDRHPYYPGIVALRVSAHFLIRRDGQVVQFVSCHRRAWHAGVSCWRGRMRCNDFSIGIELEGTETLPFPAVQYLRLGALIQRLQALFPIEEIVGHADVAPGRKADPGRHFDWLHLRSLLTTRA